MSISSINNNTLTKSAYGELYVDSHFKQLIRISYFLFLISYFAL